MWEQAFDSRARDGFSLGSRLHVESLTCGHASAVFGDVSLEQNFAPPSLKRRTDTDADRHARLQTISSRSGVRVRLLTQLTDLTLP